MLLFLQKFINSQDYDTMQEFQVVLQKFWKEFHVVCWKLNKNFTNFQGYDFLGFIRNMPSIIKFLQDKFKCNIMLSDFMKSMIMQYNISKFMTITSLHDYDGNYLKDLKLF